MYREDTFEREQSTDLWDSTIALLRALDIALECNKRHSTFENDEKALSEVQAFILKAIQHAEDAYARLWLLRRKDTKENGKENDNE